MRDYIAVFQSRRDAIHFGTMMSKHRIRAMAMGTPSAVGSSCGLSVRFPSAALSVARQLLSAGDYLSFQGFYEI